MKRLFFITSFLCLVDNLLYDYISRMGNIGVFLVLFLFLFHPLLPVVVLMFCVNSE